MRGERENFGKHPGWAWVALGLLLIAAALSLGIYNLCDGIRAGCSAGQAVTRLEKQLPQELEPAGEQVEAVSAGLAEIPDYMLNPDLEMPTETIDGIDYVGVLRIPALELELPVISQWSYPNLKTAPCRYSGSAYLNNLILCGHNYTSHFGGLKDLKEGDTATFTDMDGNVFGYQVVERETLGSTDYEEMERGDWDLTLFTCTVGGKSRVTIRFELEEN